MITLLEMIGRRRTTRHFTTQAVAARDLELLIRAGIHAPSGANTQNVRFLAVTDPKRIKDWGLIRSPIIARAPAAIAVFADTTALRAKPHEKDLWAFLNPQNVAAAMENMALAATVLKLATCWMSVSHSMDQTRVLHQHTCADMFPGIDVLRYEPWGILLVGHAKHTDANGYPLGDEKHCHQPVQRKEMETYLL